jgi:ketosteroid isomerase-like protein
VSATDAVARYRTASEAFDVDALMDTMEPDVELVSPALGPNGVPWCCGRCGGAE